MSGKDNNTSMTSEAWCRLYGLAEKIRDLTPWRWMQENHIFGVKFPKTNTFGFVSVMGTMGEHRAVTVYLGIDGLRGFWHAESLEPVEDPASIFHVPQLMASFEDRNRLDTGDFEQIQRLGLRYRGKGAWPLFRSYRPGYHPWFLTLDEVEMLGIALEQLLVIAPRARNNISLLEPDDEDSYLVRISQASGNRIIWKDRQMTFKLEPFQIKPDLDRDLFGKVAALEQSDSELDLDCIPAPVLIGPEGTRPRWPHLLMAVEVESGLIVGSEFLAASAGLPAMWSEIPGKLLSMLSKSSIRPTRIRVRSALYHDILKPLSNALKVDIAKRSALPALEEARESLFKFLKHR